MSSLGSSSAFDHYIKMDLSGLDEKFSEAIIRDGQAYLDGQVRIATAADSRASGLAGIFTATATALTAGVVIALFNPAWQTVAARVPITIGGAIAAVLFFFGAVLCIRAIMPVEFNLPGCEPMMWDDDIKANKKLNECIGDRAEHINDQIKENNVVIARNAKLFKWGALSGIAAPFIGIVAAVLLFACRLTG